MSRTGGASKCVVRLQKEVPVAGFGVIGVDDPRWSLLLDIFCSQSVCLPIEHS